MSLAFLHLLTLLAATAAWDFHGVVPQDAPVVGVAVWDNRAFLAVPRVWRDPRAALDRGRGGARPRGAGDAVTFIHDGPTLLEAPWPEPRGLVTNTTGRASGWIRSRRLAAVRAFPRIEEQVVGDRGKLQSVTAVAVEAGRGAARLWVLDSGEEPANSLARCAPKVVVFNLRGNNQRLWLRQFDGLPPGAVSGLVVDPTAADTRAYVGHPDPEAGGAGTIIVLSWKSKAFWKLRLQGMEAPVAPQAQPPARWNRAPKRCKQPPTPRPSASASSGPPCWDMALMRTAKRTPRMAIMPRHAQGIFDMALGALRAAAPDAEHRNDALVAAAELGARPLASKPTACPSCGLLGEPSGGLLYFLIGPEGGGVVRWDPRRGAGSRGHSVIHSDNASLPLSGALFLDAQGAAWAACTTFAEHRDDGPHGLDGLERDDDYDEEDEDHDDVAVEQRPPPPRPARRRNRYPRGARWSSAAAWPQDAVAQDSGEDGPMQDDEDQEHPAEPQEYVCMSPMAGPTAAPRWKAARRAGGGGALRGGAGRALDDDTNTMMVTRRREHGHGDRRDRLGVVAAHRNVLVEDVDDDAPAEHDGRPAVPAAPRTRTAARAALRPKVHCVRLQWSDRDGGEEDS